MLRLQPPLSSVPDDIARITRAAFRRGNPYLLLRHRLGAVFADAGFVDLYPALGLPAYAPWRLCPIHKILTAKGLVPSEHLVDAASVSAELLVAAGERHGLAKPRRRGAQRRRLRRGLGPARGTLPGGQGEHRLGGVRQEAGGSGYVRPDFRAEDCRACLSRTRCTRSPPGAGADVAGAARIRRPCRREGAGRHP